MAARADGVIVGSALLKRIDAARDDIERTVEEYLSSLKRARRGRRPDAAAPISTGKVRGSGGVACRRPYRAACSNAHPAAERR